MLSVLCISVDGKDTNITHVLNQVTITPEFMNWCTCTYIVAECFIFKYETVIAWAYEKNPTIAKYIYCIGVNVINE